MPMASPSRSGLGLDRPVLGPVPGLGLVLASGLERGLVAMHDLPPSEAWADTVFIRRRDACVGSALAAFLELARHRLPAQAAA